MSNVLQVDDVIQNRAWSADSEQAAVNTIYYECLTTDGAFTDQDFVDYMDSIWGTHFPPLLANTAGYSGATAQIMHFPYAEDATVFQSASAATGTAGAIGLPRQASAIISWYGTGAGPRNRGRLYIPFPASADDEGNGNPTAGYLARLGTLATNLKSVSSITQGGHTASFRLVIFHRATAPPNWTEDVFRYTIKDKWATQKRRGDYGKANSGPF